MSVESSNASDLEYALNLDLAKYSYINESDALVTAASDWQYSLVYRLLIDGANVNVQDECGKTALMVGVDEQNESLVELLLDYKADPNIPDNDGDTPLDIARYRENQLLVELLSNNGATGKSGPSAREAIEDRIYDAFTIANLVKIIGKK